MWSKWPGYSDASKLLSFVPGNFIILFRTWFPLICFALLFFSLSTYTTVLLCSEYLPISIPLPFLSPFLFLPVFSPFLFYFPFPPISLSVSLFSSLPSPSLPSPIPLFFWKSWLQQSAWNEQCIPTHALGAAAPLSVLISLCVWVCVFASVAYVCSWLQHSSEDIELPVCRSFCRMPLTATITQRNSLPSPLLLLTDCECGEGGSRRRRDCECGDGESRRRRRMIKRHAAKQHWRIEDRAGFQSGFYLAKMCSVCLRGNHYAYRIYCWPLCCWIVHICAKEHCVFMCVSDRGSMCGWSCGVRMFVPDAVWAG